MDIFLLLSSFFRQTKGGVGTPHNDFATCINIRSLHNKNKRKSLFGSRVKILHAHELYL